VRGTSGAREIRYRIRKKTGRGAEEGLKARIDFAEVAARLKGLLKKCRTSEKDGDRSVAGAESPRRFCGSYGPTEVVPCYNAGTKSTFSASCESRALLESNSEVEFFSKL
jgi:hypothetical protein